MSARGLEATGRKGKSPSSPRQSSHHGSSRARPLATVRKVSRLSRIPSLQNFIAQSVPAGRAGEANSSQAAIVRRPIWRRPYSTFTPFSAAEKLSEHQYNLERFIRTQDKDGVIVTVMKELATGSKRTHWMWFVFPQHRELGRSDTAKFYGIGSREEAAAYLKHTVLGPRLRECVELTLPHKNLTANYIFGSIDTLKFCSSLTLFDAVAAEGDDLFKRAIDQFYDGKKDEATLRLL